MRTCPGSGQPYVGTVRPASRAQCRVCGFVRSVTIHGVLRKHDAPDTRGDKVQRRRKLAYVLHRKRGWSYAKIGRAFGISGTRARQLARRGAWEHLGDEWVEHHRAEAEHMVLKELTKAREIPPTPRKNREGG